MSGREHPDSAEIARIVVDVAREVGLKQALPQGMRTKDDGSVVTDLDLRIQQMIIARLKERWPWFACLGEEMKFRDQHLVFSDGDRGFWVLDPLDGTTNYCAGFPFYGVSLALVDGKGVDIGVVYDPVRDECYRAGRGQGAYLNDIRMSPGNGRELRRCVANVDYKRLFSHLAERLVRHPPYGSHRNLGSCVVEWCWLAAGRIQLYLHGGQNIWDYAAGSLILSEAGGIASSLDGAMLDAGKLAKSSIVAASNPILFQQWYAWLQDNGKARVRGLSAR